MKTTVAGLFLAITVAMPSLADISIPQMLDSKAYRGGIAKTGDLYISGQPLEADALRKLKDEGVTTVINLRTDQEMGNRKSTPIEEDKVLQGLGLNYVHIPSGGEKSPYCPATASGGGGSSRSRITLPG